MHPQTTPLYGVLTWPNDDVADGVMVIIGWRETGVTYHPVAVEVDGHNGPARLFQVCDDQPWIDYFVSYDEAAAYIRDQPEGKRRIGWAE